MQNSTDAPPPAAAHGPRRADTLAFRLTLGAILPIVLLSGLVLLYAQTQRDSVGSLKLEAAFSEEVTIAASELATAMAEIRGSMRALARTFEIEPVQEMRDQLHVDLSSVLNGEPALVGLAFVSLAKERVAEPQAVYLVRDRKAPRVGELDPARLDALLKALRAGESGGYWLGPRGALAAQGRIVKLLFFQLQDGSSAVLMGEVLLDSLLNATQFTDVAVVDGNHALVGPAVLGAPGTAVEQLFTQVDSPQEPVEHVVGGRPVPVFGPHGEARLFAADLPGTPAWHLIATRDEAVFATPLRRERLISTLLWTLANVLVGIVIVASSRKVARPLHALTEAARRVERGDFAFELERPESAAVEFEGLYGAFNTMAEAIRVREQTLEAQVSARTEALVAEREELRHERDIVEATLHHTNQGIVMFDRDLTVLATNLRYHELLELVPVPVGETDFYENHIRHLAKHLMGDSTRVALDMERAEGGLPFTERLELRDGRVLELRHMPIPTGGAVRTITDDTAAARAEAETEQQRQRLEDVLNSIDQAIVMVDTRDRMQLRNRQLQRLLGIPDDVLDSLLTYTDLVYWIGENRFAQPHDVVQWLRLIEREDHLPLKVTLKNEEVFEIRHFPLPGRSMVNTFTRVTERERTREELQQRVVELNNARVASMNMMQDADLSRQRAEDLRRLAESATEAKANFLAAMSHEIRTPMNAIIGMSDLIMQENLPADTRQMLETIRGSGEGLLGIINDILDLSKIEAGRLSIDTMSFRLLDAVEGAAATCAHAAQEKGISIVPLIDPGLPAVVRGDPARIRQILINLIGNAVKFSEDGEVRVLVSRDGVTEDGGRRVLFRIIDEGIGISEADQAKLFQPFSQAQASTSRRYGGTGLGLSICARLVNLMGGDIGLRSEEGVGSEFHFALALMPDGTAEDTTDKPSDLEGVHVYLHGSRRSECETLSVYLGHWHANVTVIADRAELIACLKRKDSDCPVVVLGSAMDRERHDALIAEIGSSGDACGELAFVSLATGSHFTPRLLNPTTVAVDVNPIRRGGVVSAVAIAAGRNSPEVFYDTRRDVAPRRRAPSVEEAAASGRLLLVAEDNPVNRDVIRRQLTLLGYACEMVEDGQEALDALASGRHALLLTDCHMPTMDGYEATRRLRAREAKLDGGRMPVIAVTANALKGEAERCREAGMDDYLAKPVVLGDLAAMLQKWLPGALDEPDSQPKVSRELSEAAAMVEALPVDERVLKDMFGDDPEEFADILRGFVASMQEILGDINDAVAARVAGDVAFAAHKLKSSARSVGAGAVAETSLKLEQAGKADDWPTIEENLPKLRLEARAVQGYVSTLP